VGRTNLARYFAPQKRNTVAFLSALLSPDREGKKKNSFFIFSIALLLVF
jgi:hypothetical protein